MWGMKYAATQFMWDEASPLLWPLKQLKGV